MRARVHMQCTCTHVYICDYLGMHKHTHNHYTCAFMRNAPHTSLIYSRRPDVFPGPTTPSQESVCGQASYRWTAKPEGRGIVQQNVFYDRCDRPVKFALSVEKRECEEVVEHCAWRVLIPPCGWYWLLTVHL